MKKINKEILKNKFIKNTLMLVSGTAFAQVLTVLLSPIITRIYSPEEYGILTLYLSLLTLLSISASLDYEKAIPLSVNDKTAYNLLAGSLLILLSFVIVITLLLVFWGEIILGIFQSESLVNYQYLIPIGILLVAGYNILMHWSIRAKDFKLITRTKITQSIASNIGKIFFGIIGFGPIGLILGQIVGQSGGISRLSSPLISKRVEFIKSISWIEIKRVLIRYIKFPLYSAPSNYVYTAGIQAPVIMLTSMFGASAAGLYGLANSIVRLPIGLIANSVGQVFYSEVASIGKKNPKEIKKLSLQVANKLALIGLIPLVILLLFGPWLFSFVFGQDWYNAGIYARILSIVAYINFIITPVGRVLEVIEKQHISLIFNFIRLIIIILAFVTAWTLQFTAMQTVIIYSIVSSISFLFLFITVQVILSRAEKNK